MCPGGMPIKLLKVGSGAAVFSAARLHWFFGRSPVRTYWLIWDFQGGTEGRAGGSWFLRRHTPREQREPEATQLSCSSTVPNYKCQLTCAGVS